MPEAGENKKIFIVHAPEDDQGKYKGRLAHFVKFLKGALLQYQPEIRFSHDYIAGAENAEKRDFAAQADLVLLIISADFFGDPFCEEMLDELAIWRKRRGQKQVMIYFRSFSAYSKFPVLQDLPIFPKADATVENLEATLNDCFDEIANSLAAEIAAQPIQKDEKLSPEQQIAQSRTLLSALNRLNYHQQPIHFKNLTLFQAQALPAAFLVHGQLRVLGADWLIAKLLNQLPDNNPRIFRSSVDRADFNIEANGFMADVGKKLGLGAAASYEEMQEAMVNLLRNAATTIVLRFDGMRNLLASTELSAFNDFRTKFWEPLILALEAKAAHPESRLIALFVAQEEMDNCQHFEAFPPKKPTIPVRLPKVDHFDANLINEWLDNHGDILAKLPGKKPTELMLYPTRAAKIDEIIAKSQNGLPEMVLQHLCRECACDFEDILQMLAKHEA